MREVLFWPGMTDAERDASWKRLTQILTDSGWSFILEKEEPSPPPVG